MNAAVIALRLVFQLERVPCFAAMTSETEEGFGAGK
jgi:hypothetical protein